MSAEKSRNGELSRDYDILCDFCVEGYNLL